MTTKASIKALTSPNNMKTRWTHRKICHNALKDCQLTYLEIAAKVVLKPDQVWKRVSDMYAEDILIITGTKEENGQPHSIYAHNPNPPRKKKRPIKKWLDDEYTHILHIYEALENHEL